MWKDTKTDRESPLYSETTFIALEVCITGVGIMWSSVPNAVIMLWFSASAWLLLTILRHTLLKQHPKFRIWAVCYLIFVVIIPFTVFTSITNPIENRLWDKGNFGERPDSLLVSFNASQRGDQFLVEMALQPQYEDLGGFVFDVEISTPYDVGTVQYRFDDWGDTPNEYILSNDFPGIETRVRDENRILRVIGNNMNPSLESPFYISFLTRENPYLMDCKIRGILGGPHGGCYGNAVEITHKKIETN